MPIWQPAFGPGQEIHPIVTAATGPAGPSSWPLVTIPGTQARTMTANGIAYRIGIALPGGPPPATGFPVLYLLDANAGFATVVETQRRLSRRPDATHVRPAIVVGIGHATDALYDAGQRQRDYTPAGLAPEGGAEAFLAFLQEQMRPAIEATLPVDPERRILAGHSLAGHFTLWALTRAPEAFSGYVAISPSLWRDEALAAAIPGIRVPPAQVFIAAGEWEEALAPWQAGQANARDIARRRAERRMVGNARDFAAALAAHLGADRVRFTLFPDEDHASVFGIAMSRAMRGLF